MDEALDFLHRALRHPVNECGEPLADLREASLAAGVEVLFSRKPFPDGSSRLFMLRLGLMDGFLRAARNLNGHGLVPLVEDAYRSGRMQRSISEDSAILGNIGEMVAWESGDAEPDPGLLSSRLSVLVAVHERTAGHMAGAALDISVMTADSGEELDRGVPYLELSEKTPMESPFVSNQARRNRSIVTGILLRHGFVAYPYEFWHYSSGDVVAEVAAGSSAPARYGPCALP